MSERPAPIRPLAGSEPISPPGAPAAQSTLAREGTAPAGGANSTGQRRWSWLLVYFGLGIVFGVTSALAGSWTYGYLRPRLPH